MADDGLMPGPRTKGPYDPDRRTLYSPAELLAGSENGLSLDDAVDRHFRHHQRRHPDDAAEALAQRLHDYAIDQALQARIGASPAQRAASRIVGIMGGHAVRRGDDAYRAAARTGFLLASADDPYLVATGGGPGVMEAGNLGAALSGRDERELLAAIDRLANGPEWRADPGAYLEAGLEVAAAHGPLRPSIAIPTWFYGNEPTNVFATEIVKYFSNGLREEGLLAICLHGIVYAPGSAGTLQEIFTDHAQNHYASYGYRSPMVFLGEQRYGRIFELLRAEATSGVEPLLVLVETPEEVVAAIEERRPVAVDQPK
ncbi:MAG: Rossmann fold nucleotide-binding protein [Thermoleophilaceae bacterium]|nr:Rossmann fold nucleotide-binding protein [Thermoleophilaceae bacterium]